MTAFEWTALIGAAAWIPQIVGVINRYLTKPQVVVVPVPQIEVGYNAFGPMLNLKATLIAKQKDAIVIDMKVTLRHERGKVIQLEWSSFAETFSALRSSAGETTEVSRDQEATSLKLSTSWPTEKFIRFQDGVFQEQYRVLIQTAEAELTRIESTTPGAADIFLRSKEFKEVESFLRHNMPWEPGDYEITLSLQVQDRKDPAVARVHFRLTASDTEKLQNNVALAVKGLEDFVRKVPEEERGRRSNWALPRLASKNVMVRT